MNGGRGIPTKMSFTTADGVTCVLPEIGEAELCETTPASFVPQLRAVNMGIPLGWFAINVTRVYCHMLQSLLPKSYSPPQQKSEERAMLKRVRQAMVHVHANS